jgi:cytochrome oxidase Cu insertion factor (SCO1/SenC/PrrC family)
MKIKHIQIILWIIVAAVGGSILLRGPRPKETSTIQSDSSPVAIGGPFSLTDQSGKTRTDAEFRGQWMLVYFGFTHCPDICPTGLLSITQALDALGPTAKNLTPIFISLDPARDTPDALKPYLANFSPRLIGLTGSAKAVEAAAYAYKVYYSKQSMPNSELGYVINHSGFMYLMGPDGRYVAHFNHDIASAELAKNIAAAMAAQAKE